MNDWTSSSIKPLLRLPSLPSGPPGAGRPGETARRSPRYPGRRRAGDPPGGVVYNRAIRETIAGEVRAAGLEGIREYPLGDGRVSFGQVVCGGERGGAMEAALPYFTG